MPPNCEESPVIAGPLTTDGKIVNVVPGPETPPLVVTTIFPVVAPVGTYVVTLLFVQLSGIAATPLNVRVPGDVPNRDPVMLTRAPIGPPVGYTVAIVGVATLFTTCESTDEVLAE